MIDQRADRIRTLSIWAYWFSVPTAIGTVFLEDLAYFVMSVLIGLTGLSGYLWTKAYVFKSPDRSRMESFFLKFLFWHLATCLALAFPTFFYFVFGDLAI